MPLGDAAIFITKQREVMAARKADVAVFRGRKLALQKTYKAELHVGGEKHKGFIPAWALERLEAWKAGDEVDSPSRAAWLEEGVNDEPG